MIIHKHTVLLQKIHMRKRRGRGWITISVNLLNAQTISEEGGMLRLEELVGTGTRLKEEIA